MDKLNFDKKYKKIPYKGKYKKIGFVGFSKDFFFNPNLGVYHLKIAGVLELHAFGGKKRCFPSIRTIAEEADISIPVVVKCIKDMAKLGYIEIDKIAGKSHRYYLKFW